MVQLLICEFKYHENKRAFYSKEAAAIFKGFEL